MAKKKKSPNAVHSGETVITAPGVAETTMLPGQPDSINVHATEELVLADNSPSTIGTNADEAAADTSRAPEVVSHDSSASPYTCAPIAIDVGPGLATYWVPKHLLNSPKWSSVDVGKVLRLPGVSAATGHTLVHYLYTGTYQTLETKGEDEATPARVKFKQALLTHILASAYKLQDLQRLAKEQIETYGSHMALLEIMDTVRKESFKLDWPWFHEYLQAKVKVQFDLDYTLFTSKAFLESLGKTKLYRFMMNYLLEIFSNKLALVDSAAGGTHQRSCYPSGLEIGRRTSSNEMSLEFPTAPRGDVDDVISLGTSSVPDSANSNQAIREVRPLEGSRILEERDMVQPEPTQLCEEPHESTNTDRVKNECEDIAPGPVPGVERVAAMECLEVDGPQEPEPTLPEPEKQKNDPWVFGFGAGTRIKKKKKKGAVMEAPLPGPVPELPTAPEPVLKPETVNEGDQWGFTATTTGKNKKGEGPQDGPEVEEHSLPLPEAGLVPVKEAPAVDPHAGLSKSQEKELMVENALEAEEAVKEEREFWARLVPPATQVGKKKKKKKAVVEEYTIPVLMEPEPEPAANTEPFLNTEVLPEPVQEYELEPKSFPEAAVSVASSTPCPRRPQHLLGGDGWKSCERCRAMLGDIAVQLAQENRTVLLS